MKHIRVLLAALLLVGLCGCAAAEKDGADRGAQTEAYIWTLTVDDRQQVTVDEEVGASVTVGIHLSASKEGGDTPLGVYHGELRYTCETDFGLLGAFLEQSDADAWGENDALEFELVPYDEAAYTAFTGADSSGDNTDKPALAPLVNATAMYCAPDMEFTSSDLDMAVTMPAGLLEVFAGEDGASAQVDLGEFGAWSFSSDAAMPYSILLVEPAELGVQVELHGAEEWVFRGTVDKIPLSETVAVGETKKEGAR